MLPFRCPCALARTLAGRPDAQRLALLRALAPMVCLRASMDAGLLLPCGPPRGCMEMRVHNNCALARPRKVVRHDPRANP